MAEAAKKAGGSPPNALYSLAKRLVKEGEVVKMGAGYALKGTAAAGKAKPRNTKAKRGRSKSKRSGAGRRSTGSKAVASPASGS